MQKEYTSTGYNITLDEGENFFQPRENIAALLAYYEKMSNNFEARAVICRADLAQIDAL